VRLIGAFTAVPSGHDQKLISSTESFAKPSVEKPKSLHKYGHVTLISERNAEKAGATGSKGSIDSPLPPAAETVYSAGD